MRLYIAGPMRGREFFNFPDFDAARDYLKSIGHAVISPADLDRAVGFDAMTLPKDTDWSAIPEGFDLKAAMDRDLAAVRSCDGIVLLNGWQDSAGAGMELEEAKRHGKKVLGIWACDGEPIALTKIDTGPLLEANHA